MKSNTIEKKAGSRDTFQKVKRQLDDAQKVTAEVGELMAEARNMQDVKRKTDMKILRI